MDWADFSGKKIGLLGAGKENLSLISHLQRAGAKITICDKNADQPEISKINNIEFSLGPNYVNNLDRFDYVFRSPGLPVGEVSQALVSSKKKPLVTSAMDLFLALKPCRIVGVTGTKGKGTTSSLIFSILQAAGKESFLAGNIGGSIFDDWKKLTTDSIVVLELSSFQLEDINHSPEVAVILPITEDHLEPLSARSPNFHPSVESYWEAKKGITKFQTKNDVVIFAEDDSGSEVIAQASKGRKIGVSGRYFALNRDLARATAKQLGISDDQIEKGLAAFKPLPHRLEKFAQKNKIDFIDDSYATTPEATIAALSSFNQPIIWLAGGSTKGADFTELAKAAERSIISLAVLIGREAPRIASALGKFAPKIKIELAKTLEQAVKSAVLNAKSGDIVLLSPACASKDMFRDAADRGDQFKALVNEIKL